MKATGTVSDFKQVALADAPSAPTHALTLAAGDARYAKPADLHAPVTKNDTVSIVLSLVGQLLTAVLRRKTASLASDEGLLKETADGVAVKLGSGANEAAPGNHTHAGYVAAGDLTTETNARIAGDNALAALATPTTPGQLSAANAKWLDGVQNGGANAVVVTVVYIGQKARLVSTSTGAKLQVLNGVSAWVDQQEWSEA